MKEKSKKFFTVVVALFILSIMVASVLNYSLTFNGGTTPEQEPVLTYNEFDFYPTTVGGWLTEVNGRQIALTYNPQQLEDIIIEDFSLSSLKFSDKIYLSSDTRNVDSTAAMGDLVRNIQLPRTIPACPEDLPGCENLPLKTCKDADPLTGIIYLKEGSNLTEIIQLENNCLFIQAEGNRLILLMDKLVYKELGIA